MGKPDFPRFSFFDFVLEEVSQAGAPWAAALRGLPLAFAGAASFFTDNLWLSEDAPVSSPPLFSENEVSACTVRAGDSSSTRGQQSWGLLGSFNPWCLQRPFNPSFWLLVLFACQYKKLNTLKRRRQAMHAHPLFCCQIYDVANRGCLLLFAPWSVFFFCSPALVGLLSSK